MKHFAGLDVSTNTTSICIVDEKGNIINEMVSNTDPISINKVLIKSGLTIEIVGLETGSLSHWLVQGLLELGWNVICAESRKMATALSIKTNKTDRNDAQGIAEAIRTGYFKEVHQKSQESVDIKLILSARRNLIKYKGQLKNTVRGLLKAYGIRLGTVGVSIFSIKVKEKLKDKPEFVVKTIYSLLECFDKTCEELDKVNEIVNGIAKKDEDVQLLITMPGVGPITALTVKVTIDDPTRFKRSRNVAAYVGLTPKEYSSGESKRKGGISKAGAAEVRSLMIEVGNSVLCRVKSWSSLKHWGTQIAKRKGFKKAKVAVARKAICILHRMLITRKPFSYGEPKTKEIKEQKLETVLV